MATKKEPELKEVKEEKTIDVILDDKGPIGVKVRQATLQLVLNEKPFKVNVSTTGRAYFGAIKNPGWVINGMPRPETKQGLNKLPPQMRPLGSLIIYPSIDPYTPLDRALFKALMIAGSWIQRANVIIQKLVVAKFSTEVEPRKEMELTEDELKEWQQEKINIPLWNEKQTPEHVKEWIDRLYLRLDGPSVFFNSYLIEREQGRCVIGMFPEERGETGDYVIPQALRYIEPEYTRRPILNFDTGELEAVEVIGLTSNGGRLDANRAIYMTNSDNLQLFARYYGRSLIEPVADVGKTLMTIYADDFRLGAERTWHKPNIYRLTIPARDYDKVDKIQNEFNNKLNANAGKDISVTQAVELLNPGAGANTGNMIGLVSIQNECIDAIAGYYNIPPFILAKGKAGRLGGNANREEIDSFLQIEIRPEQEILEGIIEDQFYDRILAILFQIEPEEVANGDKCPFKMKHFFDKPDIAAGVDVEQYEIAKDMVAEGLMRPEDLMDKFNIRSQLKDETATGGEDRTPTINTWSKVNKSWGKPVLTKEMTAWKPKNLNPIHTRTKQVIGWPESMPSPNFSDDSF